MTKPKTIGDLREAIKDLHDDMPIYLENEAGDPDYWECLGIEQKTIGGYGDFEEDFRKKEIEALCFNYT